MIQCQSIVLILGETPQPSIEKLCNYLPLECQQVQEIGDVEGQAAARREHRSSLFCFFGGISAEVFGIAG
jgi:hypothetical protein